MIYHSKFNLLFQIELLIIFYSFLSFITNCSLINIPDFSGIFAKVK